MHLETRTLPILATLCLIHAAAPAQNCFFLPSDTPAAGATDVQPFGGADPTQTAIANQRYQIQIPASVLGPQPLDICEVYFAPAGSRRRVFDELHVRFGHNPNALGPNMGTNTVGFTARLVGTNDIERTTVADSWWPIGMNRSFRYDPALGELLIEIAVRNAGAPTGVGDPGFRTDPSIPYVIAPGASYRGTVMAGGGLKVRLCTSAHDLIEYGGGCSGSNGQEPRLSLHGSAQIGGSGFEVRLADAVAQPNTAVALFWGFRLRSGPLDLSAIGMTGCSLSIFPSVTSARFTNDGTASASIALPVGVTPCSRAWVQWFVLDPAANPLGVVGSNFGAITVGT